MRPELLRHLQGAFGQDSPRPLTVSAVLEELEDYESGKEPAELACRLEALGQQVVAAAAQISLDLGQEAWSPVVSQLLATQLEGYEGLEMWLRRAGRRVVEGISVEDVLENVAQLQQQIREASQSLARPSWRCPCCGGPERAEICPRCGVQPLLWDRLPDEEDDCETIVSGLRAQALYCLVVRVLEGRAPLSELARCLHTTAAEVAQLGRLVGDLEGLEDGLEMLFLAVQSRRVSHLLGGWQAFYGSLVRLQRQAAEDFFPLAVAS